MKIYDLSKELFSASVFPGDPAPEKRPVMEISETCACNLTALSLGSHNGTHMDAPKHFVAGGKDMAQVALEKCVGPCKVIVHSGLFTAEDAHRALADGTKRLLIRGEIEITPEGAEALAADGLWFLGGHDSRRQDDGRRGAPRAARRGDRAAGIGRAGRRFGGRILPFERAA